MNAREWHEANEADDPVTRPQFAVGDVISIENDDFPVEDFEGRFFVVTGLTEMGVNLLGRAFQTRAAAEQSLEQRRGDETV